MLLLKINLFITYIFTYILQGYVFITNIRKQYKNNKLKIIAPTWNDEFELPDDSYPVSDIQDYIKHIIKKHEKKHKIKDWYKLELQIPKQNKKT